MPKSDDRPIGVFDSGVGGLSILIELKKLLPHENFVFLADQKYVPYGEKTKKELVNLCVNITDYFVKKHDIKMMVVACNTATCYSIKELRQNFKIPIVGTEPAVKPAAQNTRTGVIGIISTPATSKSKTIKRLITDFTHGTEVINIGCQNLENVVEEGDLSSSKVKALLDKYLSEIKNSKADRLVLGCTHYPFLRKTIQAMVGPKVKLIDSGKAIAKHAKSLVTKNLFKNNQVGMGKTTHFTTGNAQRFSKVASKLLGAKVVAFQAKL